MANKKGASRSSCYDSSDFCVPSQHSELEEYPTIISLFESKYWSADQWAKEMFPNTGRRRPKHKRKYDRI